MKNIFNNTPVQLDLSDSIRPYYQPMKGATGELNKTFSATMNHGKI